MQEKRATPTTISLKWCRGLNLKHSPHPHILCAEDTFRASCGAFKRWIASTIGPEAWGGGTLNIIAWCLILVCCDVGDTRSLPHSPTSWTLPCLCQLPRDGTGNQSH